MRAKERPWQLPSSQLLSVQALSMLRTVMSNLLRGGSEIYSQVSQRTKECQFHLGAPRMAFPCGFCAEQPKSPSVRWKSNSGNFLTFNSCAMSDAMSLKGTSCPFGRTRKAIRQMSRTQIKAVSFSLEWPFACLITSSRKRWSYRDHKLNSRNKGGHRCESLPFGDYPCSH